MCAGGDNTQVHYMLLLVITCSCVGRLHASEMCSNTLPPPLLLLDVLPGDIIPFWLLDTPVEYTEERRMIAVTAVRLGMSPGHYLYTCLGDIVYAGRLHTQGQ